MLTLFRTISLAGALLLCSTAAYAQVARILPSESELNRVGLTMAWWGQAAVDPSRDRVDFLTADEQAVYIQSSTGILTTFHGETGRRLWSQLLGAPGQQGFPVSTNDTDVLVAIGMNLYAHDKLTGRRLWELRMQDHPSASPTVNDSQIFVGTTNGSVYSYNLSKVRELYREGRLPQWAIQAKMWRFQSPAEIVSPPVASRGTVTFASEVGILYGMTANEMQLRYQLETSGRIRTSLGYSQDYIFVADSNWRLYCVEQATGRVVWVFSSGSPIRQKPKVVGSHVYVVPHREGLAAVSLESGRATWQQAAATQVVAVTEKHVYASDINDRLLILDRSNGRVQATLNVSQLPLRVSNERTDRIYLASPTGLVIGLRELSSDLPVYHLYPERRPILPELATDEPEMDDTATNESDDN